MSQSLIEQVNHKLKEIEAEFSDKALAYLLFFESNERKLSLAVKNKIKERYGRETFSPTISWKSEFDFVPENQADSIDEQIEKYLETIGYTNEAFLLPRDRLKNMLWKNAREKARQILDNLE